MTSPDPYYCPDPLASQVTKAQAHDESQTMTEVPDLRVLEVRALCRIADSLTTLTTMEMNR
ncbi:hypothetical protein [Corynebacterium nuruki]|uniref:hypothetical protein n=1 Tax=Corynebacterium nuruki TaxID=1032851 RepID=UPI0039BF24D6